MMALAVAALVAVAWVSYASGRTWLYPGAFFSGFWTIIVLLAVVGAPDYKTPWIGPAWIALACAAVSAGCAIGSLNRGLATPTPTLVAASRVSGYPAAIIACVCLGISYLLIRAATLGLVWSFDEEGPELPSYYQALLATYYAGPAFGGLYFLSGKKWARVLGLISLLPAVLTAMLYLRRSWLLMSGMFWLGGLFSFLILGRSEPVRLFTMRRLALGLGGIVLLAGVALVFQVFRMGLKGSEISLGDIAESYAASIGDDKFDSAWERVRVILFGYPVPFSNWLDRSWDHPDPQTWGAWTFAGPARLFGVSDRVRIEDYVQDVSLGNLYTAFYGLVLDFSPFGALVVLFGFGVACGWAYRAVSMGQTLAIPILVGFYATTIFSPLWSLFRYNALIVALVYLALFFFWNAARKSPAPSAARNASRKAAAPAVKASLIPTKL